MPLKSFLKKNILVLALIFFVYAWYFATHVSSPNQKVENVLSASSNITLFVQPSSGREPILNALNSAQKEILVEVYLLSDKQVIAALESARSRGVNVDVMLEEHPFGGGNLNNKSKAELENHNISFEWTNPSFSLTHEKAIIIDNDKVFILNQNLTDSSFSKNREYDILDTNAVDVAQARSIFISDWQRKTYTINSSTNLIVSPINSRLIIANLISSSKSELDIEIEDIADDQVTTVLDNKAKNITVRLLVPTLKQISSNEKDLDELIKNGVKIRTLSSPYIHAKLILADRQKAYIGSVNLSTQSMDKNRELGIIISDPNSLQTLESSFETDWNRGKDLN